jgi:hypothetical protein
MGRGIRNNRGWMITPYVWVHPYERAQAYVRNLAITPVRKIVDHLQPIADHLKDGALQGRSHSVRSTGNHQHLHQRHRAWMLERNARSDIDWSADGCSFGAPEIGRS